MFPKAFSLRVFESWDYVARVKARGEKIRFLFSPFHRYSLLGMDMALSDYDGRTALHLAAAEGHEIIVKFLLEKCKVSPYLQDRLVTHFGYFNSWKPFLTKLSFLIKTKRPNCCKLNDGIFSSAVFGEILKYCFGLDVVDVRRCYKKKKLWHFVISLLLLKTFTWNSEYVFTIQRAIHTIKGDNSKCIIVRTMPLFLLRLFILHQASHGQALPPVLVSKYIQQNREHHTMQSDRDLHLPTKDFCSWSTDMKNK